MALEVGIVEVPFATGLQQKSDPNVVDVGAATTLRNGVIDKTGAISKRPGITVLNPANFISQWGHTPGVTGSKCRVFRNVLGGMAMIDEQRVWAYSPKLAKYVDVDAVPTLTYEELGITAGLTNIVSQDIATDSNYVAMAYTDATNNCYLVVLDAGTRAVIYGPQQLSTTGAVGAAYVRVIICNGAAICVWQSSGTPTSLYGRALTLSTLTLGAQTLLRNDHTAAPGRFDIHTQAGASNVWTLFHAKNAGVALRVENFNSALTSLTSVTFNPPGTMTATIYGVTLHGTSGEQIWCAYSCPDLAVANQHTRIIGLNPTTLATTTADTSVFSFATALPDVMRIGLERLSSTSCLVVASMQTNTYTQFRPMTTTGVSWASERIQYSHVLASKPFTIDRNVCCLMIVPASSSSGGTYIVADLAASTAPAGGSFGPPGRPVCTIAPRIVQKSVANFTLLPSAALYSTQFGVFLVGSSIRNGQGTVGMDLLDVTASYISHQIAELGGILYFSGGVPSEYDGQRYTEIGFLQTPPSVVGSAGGGGAMAAGNYTYLAVYEWIDANGARVQSLPVTSGTIAVGAAGQVTLTVECQHMTTKEDAERSDRPVAVAFYRTTLAGGTGIFYRIFGAAIPASAIGSVTSQTVVYVDQLADASIVVNETYNTQQLVNGCPPSLSCLVAHQGRLAGANGNTVWLSKQYDGGTNQPQFSDTLTIQVGDGGKITALASMDGQLVVFKRNSIFVIAGDGPNTSGIGSTWSDPRLISSDVGCTSDWRSTLVTKDGVIFQSEKKLHMLTRGFEVVYLSQPVESLIAAWPVVNFVALHSRRDEIRIGLTDVEGNTLGRVLNWNYVTACWSEFRYYDLQAGDADAAFANGAAIDGVFHYVNGAGWVHRENTDLTATSAYYDGPNWVTLQVETAWAKASGVLGWGRFWYARFATENTSPHDVTLEVAHDYSSTYAQSGTWTAAQQLTFTGPGVEIHVRQQKSPAIRARLTDAAPTGVASTTGSGPTLFGAHFEAGLYHKGKRFATVQGA